MAALWPADARPDDDLRWSDSDSDAEAADAAAAAAATTSIRLPPPVCPPARAPSPGMADPDDWDADFASPLTIPPAVAAKQTTVRRHLAEIHAFSAVVTEIRALLDAAPDAAVPDDVLADAEAIVLLADASDPAVPASPPLSPMSPPPDAPRTPIKVTSPERAVAVGRRILEQVTAAGRGSLDDSAAWVPRKVDFDADGLPGLIDRARRARERLAAAL
ncbi:uncharacterized protein V1510DRAFT_404276 [Dipodascopsis tothii]|uniref:uncharacterized protein n=1 Tax=Dipodascopsis tothii TaxID=44089 RepID=UPI0034CDFC87